MHVIDIVSGKDPLAVSHNLNTNLSSERARKNADPHDSKRGRVTNMPPANGVQTRTLDPVGTQIANHGRTDQGLPDVLERVEAERTSLLRNKVCFDAPQLNLDVGTKASDQMGLRGYAITVVLGLNWRRRVHSSRSVRDNIAYQADVKRGKRVKGDHGNPSKDISIGARHWGRGIFS